MQRRLFLVLGTAGALAAAGCSRKAKLAEVPRGATVLALGDSITFGTGTTPPESYPSVLSQITGWQVVNAGVPGDTSAGALQRLPALLQEHTPKLVIVSIGGNDFLRRLPEAATRDNIRAICQQAAAAGAQVLLVGVPQASAMAAVARSLSDHPMYAEIAKDLKVPLHAGGWAEVLSTPSLRSDPIHANAQGYAQFAERLALSLRENGLWK